MKSRGLTDKQRDILIQYFKEESLYRPDRYQNLLLELLAVTAMRTDELVRLKVKDLVVDDCRIDLREGSKNGEDGLLPIPQVLFNRLTDAVAVKVLGPEDYLVSICIRSPNSTSRKQSLQRYWRLLAKDLFGFSFDKGLHCLRHTAAVIVYKQTNDILAVQKFLRHKQITSTQHYLTHINYEENKEIYRNAFNSPEKKAV